MTGHQVEERANQQAELAGRSLVAARAEAEVATEQLLATVRQKAELAAMVEELQDTVALLRAKETGEGQHQQCPPVTGISITKLFSFDIH